MNIKEFIEKSGLIEDYVLGKLSPKDAQGVECLSKTYPEIALEIADLQKGLNAYASTFEKKAPAFLKDQIFAQMTFADEQEQSPAEQNLSSQVPNQKTTTERETKVLPLWSKFAAAASIIFTIGTAWLYFQNQGLSEQKRQMVEEMTALKQSSTLKANLLSLFEDPENKLVNLNGSDKSKTSQVQVFWNIKTNKVSLFAKNLPKAPTGKQYQLWIIGEKGPEDMGMLDNSFENTLLSMKNVNGKPKAFAITLEKEGGVPAPTLSELYVIGNV
jgi:anti-sigma-K factor RskA